MRIVGNEKISCPGTRNYKSHLSRRNYDQHTRGWGKSSPRRKHWASRNFAWLNNERGSPYGCLFLSLLYHGGAVHIIDAEHQYSSPCRLSASTTRSSAGMRTRFANCVCELSNRSFTKRKRGCRWRPSSFGGNNWTRTSDTLHVKQVL